MRGTETLWSTQGFIQLWGVCLAALIWLQGTVTAPALRGGGSVVSGPDESLVRAGAQLLTDLRAAQNAASAEGNPYRVVMLGRDVYLVHDDDNGNGFPDNGERTMFRGLGRSYPDVRLSGPSSLTLLPSGTCRLPGTLTLTSANGKMTLAVESDGGVVVR